MYLRPDERLVVEVLADHKDVGVDVGGYDSGVTHAVRVDESQLSERLALVCNQSHHSSSHSHTLVQDRLVVISHTTRHTLTLSYRIVLLTRRHTLNDAL